MALSELFEKRIDRPIEGVIKADDEESLRLEVEEYVLTNEIAKRLDLFLDAYNSYEGANGVWISGFFGSGKSHLLKMLALLLENRQVEGTPTLDLFLPKCGDNKILSADLEKAVGIPSKSILFNIDQKADVISKTQVDALLAVFVKVFDEMCGYYGKQGHIAQFERDLDSRGQYGSFKKAYRDIADKDWEFGREQAILEGHHIAAAYARATSAPEETSKGILDKYRADYKVSIEDFAEQVNAYIDTQGPNFRLNFFVDEVGQYVADNVKLMTNLQTVAESLATKCRGRSWILVTAQEDMETVLGEMGKQQTHDFSKIQDRFKTRMKLTSADVSEVVRRRLLLKNERGIEQLSKVYMDEHNNFRTLFEFTDGSQTYRNFRDKDEFIHSYPFITYQFELFQSAIQSLSLHNAFEGKHSAVGERSMLAVFQQVAIQIREHSLGQLATFDLMFEGIRAALKSNIQHSVITAERHLEDPFPVEILKALFLVKYVKEFVATARNLRVLMLDSFDRDVPGLRKRLEEGLNLLEQQTYIQRNAEEYEYLTDQEKDVEEEIKNTEVDTSAVSDELVKLVFDYVIRDRKIRYEENGQDYPFSRKLDDRLIGREQELAIQVISPFHEHTGDETILRAQAMGRDELLVIMPASDRLVGDLLMYKRTEKYFRQNYSTTQQESVKRILTDKQFQNNKRHDGLRTLVEKLLSEAILIVDGRDVEVGGSDPQTRIVKGFFDLIVRTYTNLGMLRGITYTENDVANCLKLETTLFGGDKAMISEAEQEMMALVQRNNRGGLRTTMKLLVDQFEHKPYGWYLAAIQCTLGKLIGRGKIEIRHDGNLLEEEDVLEKALRNTHGYANLILYPQEIPPDWKVRWLKDFFGNFFDQPLASNEFKAIAQETAAAFKKSSEDLVRITVEANSYPFASELVQANETLEKVTGKPYTFYLTDLDEFEDELFDLKEQVLDPIRSFMSGSQKDIYDEISQFLSKQKPNFAYVGQGDADSLRTTIEDPHCYRGYTMMKAKKLVDGLRQSVEEKVKQERDLAVIDLDKRWALLSAEAEFEKLEKEQQDELRKPFDELNRGIENQPLVPVIRDSLDRFENEQYPDLLTFMSAWASASPDTDDDDLVPPEPQIRYVSKKSLHVIFDKAFLSNEDDVDAYLATLKETLMREIREGNRIQI